MNKRFVDHMQLALHIARIVEHVGNQGIRLELRADFGHLVRLCETLEKKPYPTAMFNPLHHHIGPDNGLWLKGTDEDGEVVHVQALRFDDYTGTTLAREFENLTAFYSDPSVSASPGEYCRSLAPAAERITGPTVYHGELWLKSGRTGRRGHALSKPLGRLAMALALCRWQPAWYYGITYDGVINRGLHHRYGFWHAQEKGVYWVRKGKPPLDVHLVWLTGEDLYDLVSDWGWHNGEGELPCQIGEAGESRTAVA